VSTLNTVRRNTAFNAAARVAMLLVWVGVTPQALARLGPERFGFWAVLLLIGGALTIIDLGLGAAVVTYTARVRAEGGTREVRRTVGRALRVYLLLAAGLVTAAIAATRWCWPSFTSPVRGRTRRAWPTGWQSRLLRSRRSGTSSRERWSGSNGSI